jgi:hypothetical protein
LAFLVHFWLFIKSKQEITLLVFAPFFFIKTNQPMQREQQTAELLTFFEKVFSNFQCKIELVKMPVVENCWSSSPLTFVNRAFQKHLKDGEEWPQSVENFFAEKLSHETAKNNIVSLNDTPNHMLIDGQVARFRCMIQVRRS